MWVASSVPSDLPAPVQTHDVRLAAALAKWLNYSTPDLADGQGRYAKKQLHTNLTLIWRISMAKFIVVRGTFKNGGTSTTILNVETITSVSKINAENQDANCIIETSDKNKYWINDSWDEIEKLLVG